jgi:phosphoglycolate phosphatase
MAADRGTPAGALARPRAVLFDWDNTLVDNWASIQDALNTTLAAMGQEAWSLAEVRARVRSSARDTFPRHFGARAEEAMRIFYARFAAAHLTTLEALPGADPLLKGLAGEGVYLGVVSNKHGEFLRREAQELRWERHFARLVGAGDAAQDKPAPAPITMALEGSGITAGAEVWFVGDALIDVECARNAGCVAVLVGDGHGAETDDAHPDLQLYSGGGGAAAPPGGLRSDA